MDEHLAPEQTQLAPLQHGLAARMRRKVTDVEEDVLDERAVDDVLPRIVAPLEPQHVSRVVAQLLDGREARGGGRPRGLARPAGEEKAGEGPVDGAVEGPEVLRDAEELVGVVGARRATLVLAVVGGAVDAVEEAADGSVGADLEGDERLGAVEG